MFYDKTDIGINRDTLVCWFIKKFPQYYLDMVKSNHCVELLQPNIFHSEGTVWTHTMMVMTWIEAMPVDNEEDYVILLTSGMLHDLGKPSCEERSEATEHKPVRNSFSGHEGMSVYLGVEVLKQLQQDFPNVYTDFIVEMVLKVVGTHGVAIDGPEGRFRDLREKFRIADKKGAIRQVDEGMFSQYEKRKFAQIKDQDEEKELVIMTGLPCVGKSTIINDMFPEYDVLSRDSAVMEYFKMNFECDYPYSYNTAYKAIHNNPERLKEFDKFFNERTNHLSQNSKKVVIDMTMMPMSSRRKMMNKFPKHTKKSVVLMTDKPTLEDRNHTRFESEGKFIHSTVFENMAKSFTFPVMEEGFKDIKLIIN